MLNINMLCNDSFACFLFRLHAMMREKIGGELIRWNATRFGTVYLFLQSFWDRKDQFKLWMASKDWEECAWAGQRTMNTLRLVCPKRTGGVIWSWC